MLNFFVRLRTAIQKKTVLQFFFGLWRKKGRNNNNEYCCRTWIARAIYCITSCMLLQQVASAELHVTSPALAQMKQKHTDWRTGALSEL